MAHFSYVGKKPSRVSEWLSEDIYAQIATWCWAKALSSQVRMQPISHHPSSDTLPPPPFPPFVPAQSLDIARSDIMKLKSYDMSLVFKGLISGSQNGYTTEGNGYNPFCLTKLLPILSNSNLNSKRQAKWTCVDSVTWNAIKWNGTTPEKCTPCYY